MKLIKKFIIFSYLAFVALTSFSAFANDSVNYLYEATALDTVLGNVTYVSTNSVTPNSKIVFKLFSPSGKESSFPSSADAAGVSSSEISSDFLSEVGEYSVAVVSEDGNLGGDILNTFLVSSSGIDVSTSKLIPSDQTAFEVAVVDVYLFDSFGNPVPDHFVKLLSSVDTDVITTSSPLSDSSGLVEFNVKSDLEGVSVFTAYDTTADVVLESRSKVLFLDNGVSEKSPDKYSYLATGDDDSVSTTLEFNVTTSPIYVGDSVTFSLSAMSGDNIVSDYDGDVKFYITDDTDNLGGYANLPDDYTFTLSDLGEHTFSLNTSFLKEGVYEVGVKDVNDFSIKGHHSFIVLKKDNVVMDDNTLVLLSPAPGSSSVVSNSTQVITGIASPGDTVSIFDGTVKIGEVMASLKDGKFTFTTSLLADGDHEFYAATLSDVGVIDSETLHVNLTVDTTAPDILSLEVLPKKVLTNRSVSVKLLVSDETSSVSLVFNDELYNLLDMGNGVFEYSFLSPSLPGEYSLDFTLSDDLGNEVNLDDYATVNVMEGGHAAASDSSVDSGTDSTTVKNSTPKDDTSFAGVLPAVTGVIAVPDDSKVVLNWNPVDNAAYYSVYYGDSSFSLNNVVDTFTNATTWYVPNLTNGKRYYFAVIAVGENGAKSSVLSNIPDAVPSAIVGVASIKNDSEYSSSDDGFMHSSGEVKLNETGPSFYYLIGMLFLSSLVLPRLYKKWC